MQSFPNRQLILLCAACALGGALHAQTIPSVHAEPLAGKRVNFPEDLQNKTAVLVLGFNRGAQEDVTAWSKRLAADYRDSPSVLYYEIAMLASVPRPIRGLVIRSMKRSVPDRAQPRFLPLTTDEAAWRTLAHSTNGDTASILVVDGSGHLLWQTQGPATDATFAELRRHLP